MIAARIEGPAYSAFPDGIEGTPTGLQEAAQIHVVVVADTDLLMDQFNSSAPDSNALFILNTLDNLAAGDALTNIRPRAPADTSPHKLERMRHSAEQAYGQRAIELGAAPATDGTGMANAEPNDGPPRLPVSGH